MKPRQRTLVLALAALALFGAHAVSAAPLILTTGDKIKLEPADSGGSFQSGSGGEFRWTGVTVANSSSGSFISFCVEMNQTISFGSTYSVTLNNGAVAGGLGANGTYAGDTTGSAGFDPLSNATAWLFTQYLTNTSALTGFGSYSDANAGEAQEAIWYLENELGSTNGKATTWANQAIAAAQGGYQNPNVYILNLGVNSINQDQLYLMPIPEPDTYAMMLAGLGLMGFIARRRKQQEID